ncbi:hypothetical protein ACFYVR_10600 [Rhodococcus sp. NPDC003318]|uniref:hypothetical protein n=1 Tax=Rhodococcus sp. NPDC003318 TaxID=3364503 RepID=UPI0036939DA2
MIELEAVERRGRCPSCGHPACTAPPQRIGRLLRLRPAPARCAEILMVDHTVPCAMYCQCQDPFHGS